MPLALAALCLCALLAGGSGCELFTAVDRREIPAAGSGGGGQGGQGGGGQGGQGGSQGGGGAAPIPCDSPSECPGVDDACQARTCEDNGCGVHYAPQNKLTAAQTASDCKRNVCDGQGNVVSVDDALDVLVDGDPCSLDVCVNGTPANPPAPETTACDVGGGHFCDGNGACVECLVGGDCPQGVCAANACVPASCVDGVHNGQETDLDCGGPDCPGCADLLACAFSSDCLSEVCFLGQCKAPTCLDNVQNGQETDLDCGGAACPPCDNGEGCAVDADCASDLCSGTTCLPSCSDGLLNNQETDVDCGGPVCIPCLGDKICVVGTDCQSGVCFGGLCTAPFCGDGYMNGAEECDDGNTDDTDGCLTTCLLATCGDGFVHAGVEACDDGNADDTDGCVAGCVAAACGDGFVQFAVEPCDDGNVMSGDGCASDCSIEGCGDGTVAGTELCDDGNTDNTDACPNTCVPAACGDGYVQAGVEACDDGNAVDTDACTAACAAAACGDGIVWAGVEACDDGDLDDNDGCASYCAVEAGYACAGSPSACASAAEINCNDGADNDGDGGTDCADADCALGCNASVGPCAAGQILLEYAPTNTPLPIVDLAQLASAVTHGGLGTVARAVARVDITHTYDGDLDLSLISPSGSIVDLSSDNGSLNDNYTATIFNDACATLITAGTAPYTGCFHPEQDLATLNGGPAKGIWTLSVYDDANGDVGTLNAWRLSLCVTPSTCGNGVLDAGEGCDDQNSIGGDGCDGVCAAESGYGCAGSPSVCAPICGDGILVGGEACDDGNPADGDGCSAACGKELGFICAGSPSVCVADPGEPNDTFAEADARALDPVPVLITGDASIDGAIPVIGDKDTYKMVLAADQAVRIETFDATGTDCAGGITTTLRLFSATQAQLYMDTVIGDISGINGCSSLVVNLAAGTYYVRVEENGNNAIVPAYRLEVKLLSDQGAEAELNDSQALASPLPGSDVVIFGGHQVNADIDFFAITVPVSGMSVVAELIEGSAAETCESGGIDALIALYDGAGLLLVEDDDDGRGTCPRLDGTGATPADTAAHNLAAGTYYLRVRPYDLVSASGQFDYRLAVTVRAP